MHVCVVGAGAVGGYVAARLARAGHAVAVVARGAQLDAIRAGGLRLVGADGGVEDVRVRASDKAADLAPGDLVVLAVKAHQIAALAPTVAALLRPAGVVVALQNGLPWWYFDGLGGPLDGVRLDTLDPGGSIAAHIPTARVLGCVTWGSFEVLAPGTVRAAARAGARFSVGEPSGGRSSRLDALVATWNDAGIPTVACTDIRHEKWLKAWGNLAFNSIGALCHATVADVHAFAPSRALAAAMMREAEAVAGAVGVRFPMGVEERLDKAATLGDARSSTQQDVEAGRPLEVEALLGAIVEIARRTGVVTPCLDAMAASLRLVDHIITRDRVRFAVEPLQARCDP
jgi:2-dehydropantoate 2-reductase